MKKAPGAPCKKHGAPGAYAFTLVAAAAGKQNDGNDDEPKSAVVKQIAKTVIHNRSSIKSLKKLFCFSVIIL